MSAPAASALLFSSYWIGGFECSTHITRRGRRLDLIAATQHDQQVLADYGRLRSVGITKVRDGVRWHLMERSGQFDFSSLAPFVEAAEHHQMQVIWDLCHYGWPDDLDVFSPTFVDRFAQFAGAVASFIREHSAAIPFYCPINEISFLAWAAGQVGYIHPCAKARGGPLKAQLVRAAIAGMEAIWAVEPRARMVQIDPIIHAVSRPNQPRWQRLAARQRASQYDAWDMLAGRRRPELGGDLKYLDVVGVNFYYDNQWETTGSRSRQRLVWEAEPRDPRWRPLHEMLATLHARYGRPLFIAETSHVGTGRGRWIREIAAEVRMAQAHGTPVHGICLYPIIDRPDWDRPSQWHQSGLWDVIRDTSGQLNRVLNAPYARDWTIAQRLLNMPAPDQQPA